MVGLVLTWWMVSSAFVRIYLQELLVTQNFQPSSWFAKNVHFSTCDFVNFGLKKPTHNSTHMDLDTDTWTPTSNPLF